jgi:lipopolysaccharide export system protein LptA
MSLVPNRPLALTLALLALGTLAAPLPALEGDQDQPVFLESDSAELDDQSAKSVYRGNVVVTQGSIEIRADEVEIHHHPDRRPRLIIATGNPATYRQTVEGEGKEMQAEALRMEFETDRDEIVLIGEAVVFQGEDQLRSDRIVYDRATALVKAGASAQGRERVRIQINPSER